MTELTNESALPALRVDLQLNPGIRELDGSKTWTVFDPLRHQYFQIDYKNLLILKLWSSSSAGVVAAGSIVDRLAWLSISLD